MLIAGDEPHRFLIHDRDSIYSAEVDRTITAIGLTILKAPVRAPQANAFCERLIGTIRRECLDWVIPLSEGHVRSILREWVAHYNRGVRTRASGRAFPTAPTRRCYKGIASLTVTVWLRNGSSMGFITSTVSSKLRREANRRGSSRIIAEYRHHSRPQTS